MRGKNERATTGTFRSGIFSGKVPDEVVSGPDTETIYSALTRGPAYAYTLALAQLRNGKADDCHKSLTMAVDMDGAEPSGLAWLVQGELLKQYGLGNAAAGAFDRARTGRGFGELEFATVLLRH